MGFFNWYEQDNISCHPETLKWEKNTDSQFFVKVILQKKSTFFLWSDKQRDDKENVYLDFSKISINNEHVNLR
jgi:hypothetical protein